MSSIQRCNNFPCQLTADHPGLCSSTGDGECFSDQERHARIQTLIAQEDQAEEGAHLVRLGNPEILLQRIEAYLTEQTDRAYVAFYRANRQIGMTQLTQARMPGAIQAWQDLGDARELVRRRIREMQQSKLRGTRSLIHADYLREKGESPND